MNEPAIIPDTAFKQMITECQEMLIEKEFNLRWDLIKVYHELGGIILSYVPDKEPKVDFCNAVAEALNKSQRTVYYAISFAQKYPRLDKLPEGKAISWRKITKLLDGQDINKEDDREKCPTCGRVMPR